jgi:hypothetical protein
MLTLSPLFFSTIGLHSVPLLMMTFFAFTTTSLTIFSSSDPSTLPFLPRLVHVPTTPTAFFLPPSSNSTLFTLNPSANFAPCLAASGYQPFIGPFFSPVEQPIAQWPSACGHRPVFWGTFLADQPIFLAPSSSSALPWFGSKPSCTPICPHTRSRQFWNSCVPKKASPRSRTHSSRTKPCGCRLALQLMVPPPPKHEPATMEMLLSSLPVVHPPSKRWKKASPAAMGNDDASK